MIPGRVRSVRAILVWLAGTYGISVPMPYLKDGAMNDFSLPTVVSFTAVQGGPDAARSVGDAVARANNTALELHDQFEIGADEVGIWVDFLLPGEVWRPDFAGVRVGLWLGRLRTLVVQVAVPVRPFDRAEADLYVHDVIVSARELFHPGLRRKRQAGSTAVADAILAAMLDRPGT